MPMTYRLESKAPRAKRWRLLSVSKLVPFTDTEIAQYKQLVAERTTWDTGRAVFADQIELRTVTHEI